MSAESVEPTHETVFDDSAWIIPGIDIHCLYKSPALAITTWKWLRAMCEHEAHHRGQIYLMLGMLEVPTPPLFGLTSEEVRARSA